MRETMTWMWIWTLGRRLRGGSAAVLRRVLVFIIGKARLYME